MAQGKKLKIPIRSAEAVDEEAKLLIAVSDLAKRLKGDPKPALLDIRSEMEFKMLSIEGAKLATREVVEEIFNNWAKDSPIVIVDHLGKDLREDPTVRDRNGENGRHVAEPERDEKEHGPQELVDGA